MHVGLDESDFPQTYFTEVVLSLWGECIPSIFKITYILWKNENRDF